MQQAQQGMRFVSGPALPWAGLAGGTDPSKVGGRTCGASERELSPSCPAWHTSNSLPMVLGSALTGGALRRGQRHLPLFASVSGGPSAAPSSGSSSMLAFAGQVLSGKKPLPNMSGTWIKDKKRSDSMDHAIKMMRLNGLVQQAIKLIRGIRITQTETEFTMAVFSIFAWFKVTERYSLSGQPSTCKRRDLRRGKHTGTAHPLSDGSLQLRLEWGPPLGGVGSDTFKLVSPDELHVRSQIDSEGQQAVYNSVYFRKGSKPHADVDAGGDKGKASGGAAAHK